MHYHAFVKTQTCTTRGSLTKLWTSVNHDFIFTNCSKIWACGRGVQKSLHFMLNFSVGLTLILKKKKKKRVYYFFKSTHKQLSREEENFKIIRIVKIKPPFLSSSLCPPRRWSVVSGILSFMETENEVRIKASLKNSVKWVDNCLQSLMVAKS